MKKHKQRPPKDTSTQQVTTSTSQTAHEPDQGRFNLTRLDWFLAPVIAFLVGIWTFPCVGTSVNWDDLLYMSLSQHTIPYAEILNRYGHIYLQKLFYRIVGDAVLGTRVYWCFIFFRYCRPDILVRKNAGRQKKAA